MGRTKEFSSAPSSQGQQKPRATKERFAPNLGTQIRNSAQRPAAQDPNMDPGDPRSTLIMKPGQVAGDSSGGAKPRKKYGLPSGGEQHTVVMSPEQGADVISKVQSAMESHPVSQNVKPPDIELVQHEMPRDVQPDSRLMMLTEPDSPRAAAFRVLRHHVLERGHPQVIAVSGPHDGCGKTTVAVNLAMALAECGRAEVLLVDANLRNPKIASILRFVPPWCFAEQLDQHRTQPFLPWGFVDIGSVGLHVAAINPRNEQRARLDSTAFEIAMERLRLGPYRHIIVDCPSVIGNADVNLIQDSTDGVLIAARTKQATARDIRNAVDQLTPTKILGTALFES